MDALTAITKETLDSLKGDVKKAIGAYDVNLGLQGYLLESPARSLFPVLSPYRNRTARTKAPVGSLAAHWKAITKINVRREDPSVSFGYAGKKVQTEEHDYAATFKPLALGDTVDMDAQMLAQGFDDLRARSGINLLYALMIEEDKKLLGGQNFALETPNAPTGGAGTDCYVKVAARTLEGYFFGGQTVPGSASGHLAFGATTVTAVQGAVAYDWYISSNDSTWYYLTTTTVNKVTTASVPGADATPPSLPDFEAGDVTYATVNGGDHSAKANSFNGLLATCAGDYLGDTQVKHGTAQASASGAVFKSLDGGTLTGVSGSITEWDEALLELWNNSKISPTLMMMNAQEYTSAVKAIIGGGAAYTLLPADQASPRQNIVGGYVLASYLNKAVNGRAVPIETHPHIPPGTIMMVSETLPYPNNQVSNVFEVETQQEYTQFEYAMSRGDDSAAHSGPRYEPEVRAIEVFKNYFPAGCAVLSNIAAA